MTRAYDEMYLDDAMEYLGSAVEYATLSCNMDGQAFLDLFVASGVADEFGRGDVKFISGMSGIELARHILKTCGMDVSEHTDPQIHGSVQGCFYACDAALLNGSGSIADGSENRRCCFPNEWL